MKIKKILFLSLFLIIGLFLFMPNSVNATNELNKMEIEMAEPNEGEKIPISAKVILSNDTSELEYENIELSWEKYDSEGRNPIPLNITDNTLFENNTKYGFDISEDSWEIIDKDCEDKGYLFTRATEIYVNGVLIEKEQMSFYDQVVCINGVESIDIEVEDLIVGKPLPSTIKYVIKTSIETKEFVLNCDWFLGDMQTQVEENAVAEAGVEYVPRVLSSELAELNRKTDFRTKMYINGELMDYANGVPTMKAKSEVTKYTVTFDANGGIFKNDDKTIDIEDIINFDYEAFEKPTKDGYKFIGFHTADGVSYYEVMNSEVGIDKDTTFYAQWEKLEPLELFAMSKKQEFVVGVDKDLIFYLDNNRGNGKVLINGEELSEKAGEYIWQYVEGVYPSIKLSENYMKTLKVGEYNIKFILDDGREVETTFTVSEQKIEDKEDEEDNKDDNTGIGDVDTENTDKPNTDESDKDNTEKENITTDNKDTNKPTGNNPQTSDNIITFVVMLGIAMMGIVITTKIRKHIKE